GFPFSIPLIPCFSLPKQNGRREVGQLLSFLVKFLCLGKLVLQPGVHRDVLRRFGWISSHRRKVRFHFLLHSAHAVSLELDYLVTRTDVPIRLDGFSRMLVIQ